MTRQKESILALRAEGKTYNEIAKITGASKGTISYHCKGTYIAKEVKGKEEVFPKPVKAPVMIECQHCGKEYKKPWGDKKSSFCSIDCKRTHSDIACKIVRDDSGAVVEQACNTCDVVKPASEFHFRNISTGVIQRTCKSCALTKVKKWQSDNPKRYKENWKRSSHGRDRLRRKATEYNISVEDLQKLYDDAGGKCEICRNEPNRWLVVDHCHNSTKVRGILCEQCNQALGLFKDDPEVMRKAALYIERDPVVYSEYEKAPQRRLTT